MIFARYESAGGAVATNIKILFLRLRVLGVREAG